MTLRLYMDHHVPAAAITEGLRTRGVDVLKALEDGTAEFEDSPLLRQGGHDVPEEVVRRRFAAGLKNLVACYLDVVDSWQVYDNWSIGGPRLIASKRAGAAAEIVDSETWQNLLG